MGRCLRAAALYIGAMKTPRFALGLVLLASCLAVETGAAGRNPIQFVDGAVERGVADIGVNSTGPTFGDFDNDGDLDILLSGQASGVNTSKIYRNDGGSFVDVGAALIGGGYDSDAWGDCDNDGFEPVRFERWVCCTSCQTVFVQRRPKQMAQVLGDATKEIMDRARHRNRTPPGPP